LLIYYGVTDSDVPWISLLRAESGKGVTLQWTGMPTTVRSHAKINLGLGIGAPRPDGFHSLVTVYQTLELHDLVTVSAQRAESTSISISSNDGRVPRDEHNTAWRMVEHALRSLQRPSSVDIHIEKRLPVQGGLGAGSANAVAALVGLEFELAREDDAMRRAGESPKTPDNACTLHGLSWWVSDRLRIAEQIGSDVPLFLVGGAVLGMDRGQEVYPLPDLKPALWCVVAMPDIGISTPQAFRDWDASWAQRGLATPEVTGSTASLRHAYGTVFAERIPRGAGSGGSSVVFLSGEDLANSRESPLLRGGVSRWFRNDFEEVVFPQHPALAEIKRILLASGTPSHAIHASLSGSGSAVYGLYRHREDAEAAQSHLGQKAVRTELTRTISRSEYWRKMIVEERA
jgi:4-diphosphocytidyl-2-C-methyl-D-erythritol kinase